VLARYKKTLIRKLLRMSVLPWLYANSPIRDLGAAAARPGQAEQTEAQECERAWFRE
jgi:hypothetical protein